MTYEWQNEILKENCDTIIGCLDEQKIVSIVLTPKGLQIVESCDSYYGATLTAMQVDRLIEEFKDLRAKMDNN